MAKAAGCAAKLNPPNLDAILRKLPRQTNPNVLVGFDTNDDAGIYRLNENLALVQTVDFFTPIVDDPLLFGEIAAANSLSDIYAMGGVPISSLSIVGFPEHGDPEILEKTIRGGPKQSAALSAATPFAMRTWCLGMRLPAQSIPARYGGMLAHFQMMFYFLPSRLEPE